MNKKIIYFSFSVWALLSACTDEQVDVAPTENNDKVIVNATTRNGNGSDAGQPFEANQMIAIYNGVQPYEVLAKNDPDKIGIYKSPATGTDQWENLPLETEKAQGLWKSSMEKDSQFDKIIFTAITYHKNQTLDENGKHLVTTNQKTKEEILKNDFLVARSTYKAEDWTSGHVNLIFRHVLSRLDVKLFLPIGNENDGLFNKDIINKTHSVSLKNAALDYNINYAYPRLDHEGLAEITPDNNNAKTGNIQMYPSSKTDDSKLPGDTQTAVMLHFQCILPKHQNSYTAGSECLNINIDGKEYTYKPESSGIMAFEQERITTINLVLYSKKGQNRVSLANVYITDWKDDKTNIGDLIE